MKKLMLILAALPLIGSAQIFQQMKVSEAKPLFTPLLADSVNTKGETFKNKSLLDGYVSQNNWQVQAQTLTADTAGYITLAAPDKGMAVYMLEVKLRPQRYSTGKIAVSSDAMYEVVVNGESKAKKTSLQDTINNDSKKSIDIEMIPEAEYTVMLKVIADADRKAPQIKAEYVADEEVADVPVNITTEGKRRFEMRDLALGSRVTGTSISPDGRYMIVRYHDRYSKDNRRSYATLTDLRTGKVIKNNISVTYKWMPKGSTLYYTSKGSDGYDVIGIDLPSMEERVLLSNVPKSDFIWSPTEDYIVYYEDEDNEPAKSALRRYLDPDDRIPGNRNRLNAYLYDPATGVSRPLIFGNRQSAIADISPDGKRMLVTVSDYDAQQWPFYFTNLYEIAISDMKADTLFTHDPAYTGATYSPDGKQIFITAGPSSFDKIGMNAGNHPIPNDSDVQGFIMDIATGDVKPMTRDFNPSLSNDIVWNAADGKIYFIGENGFNNTIYCLDPKTGKIETLEQGVTYVQRFSIGNDESRWLSYFGQSANTSGQAYLVDLKTGKQTLVADPWKDVADDIEWGKTERWTFTAANGTEIEGFLTYPPEFDPSKKYPMIVYYYGGTSPTQHNTYSPYNAQLFASRDYVVYQLNPSGTTGYGQEFSARHVNAWGDYTADEIIEGVKKVCDEHPFIDREKVGCIGASYGGFMTEFLQTKTDIFAAAVSHAGISNVTSYWGEGYWGYSYNALAAAKSYPWTNPDLFTKHGALFNADKIHTPLLMTHGTVDTNVPIGESIQLFNALKILGQEVELITVANEDHHINDYDNRIKWQDSMMAWFAKWLQDDPRWWDSLYPNQR